jgi:quercetin dioxygenase-like cupin family protein
MSTQTAPGQMRSGTEPIGYMGMQVLMRVTTTMSGGTYEAFEHVTPPGTGVPLHTHPLDDEHLFVEQGRLRCRVGAEMFVAQTGDAVPLPAGVPHAWSAEGDETARVLVIAALSTGSGYERMFRRLSATPPEQLESRVPEIVGDNAIEIELPLRFP